jgi:hypothetical protein
VFWCRWKLRSGSLPALPCSSLTSPRRGSLMAMLCTLFFRQPSSAWSCVWAYAESSREAEEREQGENYQGMRGFSPWPWPGIYRARQQQFAWVKSKEISGKGSRASYWRWAAATAVALSKIKRLAARHSRVLCVSNSLPLSFLFDSFHVGCFPLISILFLFVYSLIERQRFLLLINVAWVMRNIGLRFLGFQACRTWGCTSC